MIPGYDLIEQLIGHEPFRLFRGRHARTGARVLIKTPFRDPPWAAEIEALRREKEILASLPIPGVLQPLALELPQSYASVMEDPGAVPLDALVATGGLDLALALSVGVQLAAILDEMHRRGMLHNGIRTDAVLCDADSGRVWLVDFSDTSGGPGDVQVRSARSMAAARLAYVSPEQTGRMNRMADARSDLYSLGTVLYELLTGAPPFPSGDALELIHSHVARTPHAVADVNTHVPEPVSNMVMKLLAKAAEERYQSALALYEDLESCADQWAAHKSVVPFPLGRRDIGNQFFVAPKLYGRAEEVLTLLAAFERACRRRGAPSSMLLVAGYSGIGKTALIQELYKPIVRQKGYFISGKFDQVVRNIPFGALVQAFRALVCQLLTESEDRLAYWRESLGEALGANGGVLAEVIPEIDILLGKQAPAIALPPMEAQNRFQRVFQNFVAALARPEHPLVLFLDDLQWADAATLSLLKPLLTSQEIQCLFLMGAYRDNEVDAGHPLQRTLAALEVAGIEVQRVALGPLRLPDLTLLVGDALRRETADVEPLARLVQDKTGGNPFFVTQFLKALEEDGYIKFDHAAGRWTYRIEAIRGAPLTDNVIDLMARKIQRLSAGTQRILTFAACIGSPFDRDTLAIVSEEKPETVARDLAQAIDEGLVLAAESPYSYERAANPSVPVYEFRHDRVQQSAYALIPAERKDGVHLTVGRLLRTRALAGQAEEKLFDIVHHLNLGRRLIDDDEERVAVARLNLGAGRKAKSATAHSAALEYFEAGIGLLGEERWRTHYELAFDMHLEAAESQYLCGHFAAAEREFECLLRRAKTALDQAKVYRLRSVQFENMSRYADAVASAREGLALFGVVFPDEAEAKQVALEREIAAIEARLDGGSIAALADLPVMTDPAMRMVLNIMTDMWSSTYILGDSLMARLLSATIVRLSLVHGNTEESAYGYVTHAITVGPVRADYAAAYEFGRLALRVNERFHDSRRRAKIYQQFHAHVNFWRQPWHTCIPFAREACRSGLEGGDFLYAAYGASTESWSAMLATQDLAQFVREYAPNVALVRKLNNTGFADSLSLILNWARALQGTTREPLSLSDEAIDENAYLTEYRDNPFFTTIHAVVKLHVCYVLGDYEQALQAARTARATVYLIAGTVWPLMFDFWNGMTLAANIEATSDGERAAWLAEIATARESFAALALHCPENFHCQSLLLSAEIARISGSLPTALECCEQAIVFAEEKGLLQYLALANELSARYRLRRGQTRLAALFLVEARACYEQWGASAKVEELERRYPTSLAPASRQRSTAIPGGKPVGPPAAIPSATGTLDLFSVIKAAQAIAGESELDELIVRLMQIAIENAGAERGSLVLEQDGKWFVHAEGAVDKAAVRLHVRTLLAEARNLPASIVNYVRRTSESIVLTNAQDDDRFARDPYIVSHRPRSVICVPVQIHGRLIGIVYLENNMVDGAFTPDRIQMMQVLSTEVAMSLENAKLIDGLKREIRERRQAQEELGAALVEVGQLKSDLEAENTYLRRDLVANVSHDLRTPLAALRGYLETLLLKENSLSVAERRNYIKIAARQSVHLTTLVEELFELARLDFRGQRLAFEPLQLWELAADVLQKFQLAAERKQINLNVEAPERIPFVSANTSLVERVFENLISNALDYTPAGGSVSVSVRQEGPLVMARVSDTGCGIAESDLPLIFDRFYRSRVDRGAGAAGAGLGLAITKRILELHDSEIRVESSSPSGTCFFFGLPVSIVPPAS